MKFEVWAPRNKKVSLLIESMEISMSPCREGWWAAEVQPASSQPEYAFSLDDGKPLPDPRSPWQPYGVHGHSRVVNHASFKWSDTNWQPPALESSILYELHVGTFAPEGNFDSVINQLDHLLSLGVNYVELMPVAEFPGLRGWGYDGVSLYAPHHAYGGPEGLKRLVDACHRRGLGVVLDVVYNHVGPEGNYAAAFGPYLTDRYRTPWGPAMNFDGPDSDHVRRFVLDNAIMWLRDYHVDALRLDAVHAIFDSSATHILEALAEEVRRLEAKLGRRKFLIAESDLNNPRIVRDHEVGGYGLSAQWSDDFHHAVHALLTGERQEYYQDFGTLADLAAALRRGFVYDGRYSPHRRRSHGRPATGLSGHKFVVCLQNHDQVGNRAAGERIGHLAGTDKQKIGAAMVLFSPFVPLLFAGEEWAASSPFLYFTNFGDSKLGQAVVDGRRQEFASFVQKPQNIPNPQDDETFCRSKLNWTEIVKPQHAEVLDWYRQLIALRRSRPELVDGRMENVTVDFDEHARWIVIKRGELTLACNLAEQPACISLKSVTAQQIFLASKQPVEMTEDELRLPPESAVIIGPQQ